MQSSVKIGIAVVLLVGLAGGGYLYVRQHTAPSTPSATSPLSPAVAKADPEKNILERSTSADKPDKKSKPAKPKEVGTPADRTEPRKTAPVELASAGKADVITPVITPVESSPAKSSEPVVKPSDVATLIAKSNGSALPAVADEHKVTPPVALEPTAAPAKSSEPAKAADAPLSVSLDEPAKPARPLAQVPSKITDTADGGLTISFEPNKPKEKSKVKDEPVVAPKKTDEPIQIMVDSNKPAPAPKATEKKADEGGLIINVGGGPAKTAEPGKVGPAPAGPTSNEEYVVQSGDSFWSIAQKKYGDPKYSSLIAKANPTVDAGRLRAGQKLILPPLPKEAAPAVTPGPAAGETAANAAGQTVYTVKAGDGFWTIAEKVYGNGKYFYLIKQANPKVDSANLKVGQQLIIPAKPTGATSQPVTGGATSRPAAPEVSLQPGQEIYVVQSGDSGFWGIAQKKYGDANLMGAIAKANPNVDPGRLRIGQKLVLPSAEDARKMVGGAATQPSATSRPATTVRPHPTTVHPAAKPHTDTDDGKPRFD